MGQASACGGLQPVWLVVGLGNPGPRYEFTPHNLGFLAIDRLAVRHNIRVSRPEATSLVGLGTISGRNVLLAKPQTFMNVSGPSVKALLEKYSGTQSNFVLVYDELALPWTGLRIRPQGSAGGHNGVKSVIQSLGSDEFARVRLGIHPDHPVRDGAEFVLAPFRKAQLDDLEELLDYTAQAVESILAEGVEKSMTRCNRRARGLT